MTRERQALIDIVPMLQKIEDGACESYPGESCCRSCERLGESALDAVLDALAPYPGYDRWKDPPPAPAPAICNVESPVGHHCQKPPWHDMPHRDRHGNEWPAPAPQGEVPPSCLAAAASVLRKAHPDTAEMLDDVIRRWSPLYAAAAPQGEERCPWCDKGRVYDESLTYSVKCHRCHGTGRAPRAEEGT